LRTRGARSSGGRVVLINLVKACFRDPGVTERIAFSPLQTRPRAVGKISKKLIAAIKMRVIHMTVRRVPQLASAAM